MSAATGPRPALAGDRPRQTSTSQVHVGDTGYGLTVFEGTRIERFPIRVLGVSPQALNGYDMILIRVGGTLEKRGLGIVAGMSGSPIYIHGKLIGALGYGWHFSKEPVGGVVPIEAMMRNLADAPLRPAGMRPLATPVQVDGLGEEASGWLGRQLAKGPGPLQVMRSPSPAGSHLKMVRRPQGITPGAAVGVQMMWGDFGSAAVGTLSWRQGDRVLAFGHSFASLGRCALPLTDASVQAVIPSSEAPFKIAVPLHLIGSIQSDGEWAIGGNLGQNPPKIRENIDVDGIGLRKKMYEVELLNHPYYAASLAGSAALESISIDAATQGMATAELDYRIDVKGLPQIRVREFESGTNVAQSVADDVQDLVNGLLTGTTGAVPIEGIHVGVHLSPLRRVAHIAEVVASQEDVYPGESVAVRVKLEPGHGPQDAPSPGHSPDPTFQVRIPDQAAPGTYTLAAYGGALPKDLRTDLGLKEEHTRNLAQTIQRYARHKSTEDLSLVLVSPTGGLTVDSRPLSRLPTDLRTWLDELPTSLTHLDKDVATVTRATGYKLAGYQTVTIRVLDPQRTAGNATATTGTGEDADATTNTTKGKPAAAGANFDWSDRAFWSRGTFVGSALNALEQLVPAPAVQPLTAPFEGLATAFAPDREGRFWVGTTGPGCVLSVDAKGAHTLLDTGETAVLSLLPEPEHHQLLVGTAPHGRLVTLSEEGRVQVNRRLESGYLWQMTPSAESTLVAGGLPARLYALRAGAVRTLWEGPQQHLRCFAQGPDGTLFLGTDGPAEVLRLGPESRTLFSLPRDASVQSLAVQDGSLYALSSGALFQLDLEGKPLRRIPAPSGLSFFRMAGNGQRLWVTSNPGSGVWEVTTEGLKPYTPLPSVQAGAIVAGADGPSVLSAAPYRVWQYAEGGSSSYISPPLDAGQTVSWPALRVTASGATPTAQVRGASQLEQWSDWVTPPSTAASRYLQLRLGLQSDTVVQTVAVVPRKTLAGQPELEWTSPKGGERWSKVHSLTWNWETPPQQVLRYHLDLTNSLEDEDWHEVQSGYVTPSLTSIDLDTASYSDGPTRLRLQLFPAGDEKTALASATSPVVVLCNTAPAIHLVKRKPIVEAIATSTWCNIVTVEYRKGTAKWQPAVPEGTLSSKSERFTAPPDATALRVVDEAGLETVHTL